MERYYPRILIVTPEVTFLPQGMGPTSRSIFARAGGLGDICATQIHALYEHGADVHLAMPNYRNVFKINAKHTPFVDIHSRRSTLQESRVHLAQDRSFYYHSKLFMNTEWRNVRVALTFQREVINRIIPEVQPDLIHCYGWMTGLIPAMARQYDIPCVFTLYNLDSPKLLLSTIEEEGVDAASFWQDCYYVRMPCNYEETRSTNPLDVLTSAIFSAHVTTVLSQTYLDSLIHENNNHAEPMLKVEIQNKMRTGKLSTLTAAPDSSFDPRTDRALMRLYGPDSYYAGKLFNKLYLQEMLNLRLDSTVPVCFWPTRLESSRAGCRIMSDVLPPILARYRDQGLQIVFISEGDYQEDIRRLVNHLQASDRVAVCDFDAQRYRLAYGGSDFVMMPMHLDPCALPCKIGQRYGALPIGHDAGAIHDCVEHLDADGNRGNGFLFKEFDANGFLWAIDQAMEFYNQTDAFKSKQIQRIMTESMIRFVPDEMVKQTITLYEGILGRPLVQMRDEFESAEPVQQIA